MLYIWKQVRASSSASCTQDSDICQVQIKHQSRKGWPACTLQPGAYSMAHLHVSLSLGGRQGPVGCAQCQVAGQEAGQMLHSRLHGREWAKGCRAVLHQPVTLRRPSSQRSSRLPAQHTHSCMADGQATRGCPTAATCAGGNWAHSFAAAVSTADPQQRSGGEGHYIRPKPQLGRAASSGHCGLVSRGPAISKITGAE